MFRSIETLLVFALLIALFGCKIPSKSSLHKTKTASPILLEKTAVDIPFQYEGQVKACRILYKVDSIAVGGFIVVPEKALHQSLPYPTIIYNRGGNRDFGIIHHMQLDYLFYLASKGFVVYASQYRGNTMSKGGKDEFGGQDLRDVLALFELIKADPFADQSQIMMLGFSRGGLMTYLAARQTDQIKALAVVGAPTDLQQLSKERPRLYRSVLKPLVGDTLTMQDEYLKRSPVYWAAEINEPLLILHAEDDRRVNVKHANSMITALQAQNNDKNLTYRILPEGGHGLRSTAAIEDYRDSLIVSWFKQYLQ